MYRQFAVKYSADQRAPGALFNASLLYKGLNNKDKASSLLDRFVKFYPKHKIASDAYMELAEIYETQGNYQFARNTYRAFSKKFSKDVNRSLLADAKAASIRTFNISESKGLVELRSVAKRLNAKNAPAAFEARRTVAKAMYTLVDPAFAWSLRRRLLGNHSASLIFKSKPSNRIHILNMFGLHKSVVCKQSEPTFADR